MTASTTSTLDRSPAGQPATDGGAPRHADVLVVFGITGDLAKVMTFRSLYRLEQRRLLDCPIVGVAFDDWTVEQLRANGRASRSSAPASSSTPRSSTVSRARLSYVHGDFADEATYGRVAKAIGGRRRPVFYLEVPPSLFGTVVKGLAGAGLTEAARVVVEKPFGHDLASASELAAELHEYIDESQLYRIDHYLGKMGLEEITTLRLANTMLEPIWSRNYVSCVQITMAESFGVDDRGHFYDPVGALRDVVVNHLMQVVAAAAMEAPARGDPVTVKDAQVALFRSVVEADPAHYVRGQHDGYLAVDGVASGSTTETYAALRLEIENWRWAGVPFFIRTGKRLPVTQTELRLVFKRPPRLGFRPMRDLADPNQLVIKLDPTPGIRLVVDAHRADAAFPEPIELDMEFAEQGGEGPTPYEVLLEAALVGDSTRFTRQDGVEETWRIMQPLLDSPPPVHAVRSGLLGPGGGERARRRPRSLARTLDRVMSGATASSEPTLPSAAALSPFPPIAEYAFLSDCHTGALVAPDGAIEWLCVPRFDAPSVFGCLLDREAGFFRFGPFGTSHPTSRDYEPGTNVLVTTWKTAAGWVRVHDALTMGPWDHEDRVTPHTRPPADDDAGHMLVRTIECLEGRVEVELVCEPVFDYGREPATWSLVDGGRRAADATGAGQTIRLQSDLALGIEGNSVRARHMLDTGDRAYCVLSWAEQLDAPQDVGEAEKLIAATTRFWRRWLAGARIPDHRLQVAIQRSVLAIKGLTFMPTGATVAALTTSLPETPGGERNWDYRYTWMRDTTFTLQALHWLNLDWEADEFMQFVADLEATEDGGLQIMYGIDGRRDLTESTLDHLTGYAGAKPVRIGNGAFDQRQNDVFGAVLDSILLHTRRSERLPRRLWPIVQSQAECATAVWRNPDQGIWEARGKPQHYVSSKLMCWVALDRAAKLAGIRGDTELATKWTTTADEIRADILEHGVSDRGVMRQHYETDSLDASTLLAALFGFLPGSDERLRATVLAIADELTEHGFVLRYRTDETDDGLSGKEGTFLICSFWLVSALAIVGEEQRARDLMERLLRIASPLGLYAEEYETETARHLGNFPQAFSHLALIEAAGRIILAERLPEFTR